MFNTNSYRKVDDRWVVVVRSGEARAGDTVTVTLRNGRTKTEVLADYVCDNDYGDPMWTVKPKERPAPVNIGNLAGILGLFNTARAHLKWPAVVLGVPAANETIRLTIAGNRARLPGTVNVTSKDVMREGKRLWYGRIGLDGAFVPSHNCPAAVIDRLKEFAADPAGVAAADGRMTGRCCFCNTALSDERSTAVGYGPVCADHYGLPWGHNHNHRRVA